MSTTSGKRLNPLALDNFRRKIFIFPDHGEEKEAFRLATKLGWRGEVIKCNYEDGSKDPSDLLTKNPGFLRNILLQYT